MHHLSSYSFFQSQNSELKQVLYDKIEVNQQLLARLESLEKINDKLRTVYGLTEKALNLPYGTGGPKSADEYFNDQLYPIKSLFKKLDLTQQKIKFQVERSVNNSGNLINYIDYKQNIWDHTPTIKPTNGRISSQFGYRIHPISGEKARHHGIDIAALKWSPIYTSGKGTVIRTSKSESFGNLVIVDHGNGFKTKYAHLAKIMVEKGQLVSRYDLVGYMGQSGRSTGPHLHYEVHRDKRAQDPINFILPQGVVVD